MKSLPIRLAAGIALILFIPLMIHAGDYYVTVNGSDSAGDGSPSNPWKTITKAVNTATPLPGDPALIHIAGGEYTEALSLPEYVELYGGYKDSSWSRDISRYFTKIYPTGGDTNMIVAGNSCVVDGLILQGGVVGILCMDSSPVISHCTFREMTNSAILCTGASASPTIDNNTIKDGKEGIYLYGAGSPIIRYNTIRQNKGNAITVNNSTPSIENNILRENSLSGLNISTMPGGSIVSNAIFRNRHYGIEGFFCDALMANNQIAFNPNGGIYLHNTLTARLLHNTFYLNGSGIMLDNASPEITNNISFNNEYFGVWEIYQSSDPILRHNCLWGNKSGNYADEGTSISWTTWDLTHLIDNNGAAVEGNFSRDPLIADYAQEDYHLRPFSPCIDAGYAVPEITGDFEGTPRNDGKPDIGSDEYLGGFHYTFTEGNEDWKYISIPSVFSAPQQAAGGGSLMLRSVDLNCYGFWESPNQTIPIFENILYRATYHVSTDVTPQSLVPGMRLRFNEEDFQMGAEILINSNLDGDASPTPGGTDYEFYYRPLQGSRIKADRAGWILSAFDLVNIGGSNKYDGALFLEDFKLDWIDLSLVEDRFTTETIFDFDTGEQGWTMHYAPGYFDPPTIEKGPSFIGLRSTGTNTYGFWESPIQTVKSGKLYRARFYVSTDVAKRKDVPMIRLRINSYINQAGYGVIVDSSQDGDSSPIQNEWTMYEIYYNPPKSLEANGVNLDFDLVNLSTSDKSDGAVYLDRVEVHSMDLPIF